MRRASLVVLVVAVLLPSCKEETIVLATVPAVDGGGNPSDPVRCTAIVDCPSGSFCSKADCDEPAGTCEPFPAVCDDDEHPVCGCDAVTYWNDCLRQAAGIASARNGECGHEAKWCDDEKACADGSHCARLLGFGPGPSPTCEPDIHGTCWVLPTTCPPPTHTDRWNPCGSGATCLDTCTAIRSGEPHVRASSCP